ncbi:MAG: rhomboid family intramembrane serine protease [Pseudomonadota bacterium]
MRSEDGPRERQPIFNAPPATLWTCGVLVAIYLLLNLVGPGLQSWLLTNFAFISELFQAQFATPGIGIRPLVMSSLVTHGLIHLELGHMVLNTGFLLAFGSFVERRHGALGFLLLFAGSAAAGALTELAFIGSRQFFLIGASGAVYGMMGAFVATMAVKGRFARSTALNFVMIVLVLNLVLAMLGVSDFLANEAQVAWRAHIGGLVAGLIIAFVLQRLGRPASRR